jgi:photosystem II stability/assembly factor-like uncharacterized protein
LKNELKARIKLTIIVHMKKVILILIVFIFSSYNSFSQWIQQVSPVNHHLTEVKFINENTGWITTFSGSIMRTSNSGVNWIVQYSVPGKYIFGLSIVDSNTIYAVGYFETIVKSTNGGKNWTEIRNGLIGEGHSYEAVYFINKDTGWVGGSGNLIFKTTNGGLTFDSVIVSGKFRDFYFRNDNEGLVCGEGGVIHKTVDAGLNWTEIFVPVGTQSADFDNLTFVNNNTGFTMGNQNGKVYKTTNFGSTWDSLVRMPGNGYMDWIYFSSVNTGWACGRQNRIYKSTDSGNTWRAENTSQFSSQGYASIYFLTDSIGWCVGGSGKIIHTTTGGLTFMNVSNTPIPTAFNLEQNYPNPFNPSTTINYELRITKYINLKVYNLLGNEVVTLVNEKKPAGSYEVVFTGSNFSSGIYFYRLEVDGNIVDTKRMVLLK